MTIHHCWSSKVRIFWEGHKILRNLHLNCTINFNLKFWKVNVLNFLIKITDKDSHYSNSAKNFSFIFVEWKICQKTSLESHECHHFNQKKYKNIFICFLVQMKTLKFGFKINWPLGLFEQFWETFHLFLWKEKNVRGHA